MKHKVIKQNYKLNTNAFIKSYTISSCYIKEDVTKIGQQLYNYQIIIYNNL